MAEAADAVAAAIPAARDHLATPLEALPTVVHTSTTSDAPLSERQKRILTRAGVPEERWSKIACPPAFYPAYFSDDGVHVRARSFVGGNVAELKQAIMHELVHAVQERLYPAMAEHRERLVESLLRRAHAPADTAEKERDPQLNDRFQASRCVEEGHARLLQNALAATRSPGGRPPARRAPFASRIADDALYWDHRLYVIGSLRLGAISEDPKLLDAVLRNPSLGEVLFRTRGLVKVQAVAGQTPQQCALWARTLLEYNPERRFLSVDDGVSPIRHGTEVPPGAADAAERGATGPSRLRKATTWLLHSPRGRATATALCGVVGFAVVVGTTLGLGVPVVAAVLGAFCVAVVMATGASRALNHRFAHIDLQRELRGEHENQRRIELPGPSPAD